MCGRGRSPTSMLSQQRSLDDRRVCAPTKIARLINDEEARVSKVRLGPEPQH